MFYRLICLLIPIGILYYRVFFEMALDWRYDENYSHGFLIPLISIYLIWQKREHLKQILPSPSWWGPAILAFGLLLLTLGAAGAELFTMRFSFLLVITGVIVSLWGFSYLREILFPIIFLFFMIPLPYVIYNSLTLPLKRLATQLATFFLSLLSIPVLREGNIIHLPTMDLQVVEACSGIRSLIALMALGTIFAYLSQKSNLKRTVLILATIPIAIFANAVRITLTGILATYVNPEVAHGFFHTFSGWLVFLIAFLLLMALGRGLNMQRGKNAQ